MTAKINVTLFAALMKSRYVKVPLVTRFRNAEHYQFCADVHRAITLVGAGAIKVIKEYDYFTKCFNTEDAVYKKIWKSALTEKITEADEARDATFRGFVNAIIAALTHFDPETVDAAKRIKVTFDTFGNLAVKAINEESADITNLLQELNGKHAADVLKLNLTAWVTRLDAENKALIALTDERHEESATRPKLTMKECRAETDYAYGEIIEKLSAHIRVDGDDEYIDFVNKLNSIIDKYNNAVLRREGIAKAKKAKADANNEETEEPIAESGGVS